MDDNYREPESHLKPFDEVYEEYQKMMDRPDPRDDLLDRQPWKPLRDETPEERKKKWQDFVDRVTGPTSEESPCVQGRGQVAPVPGIGDISSDKPGSGARYNGSNGRQSHIVHQEGERYVVAGAGGGGIGDIESVEWPKKSDFISPQDWQKAQDDAMRRHGIGNINSSEPGSGARYNVGKPAYDLLPWRAISDWEEMYGSDLFGMACFYRLAKFQEHHDAGPLLSLWEELYRHVNASKEQRLSELAAVLDYGRKKYAAWNWSRGMPWSAVFGCLARHVVAIVIRGEEIDQESGLPHRALAAANIVFLLTYMETYPEGNDLPTTLKPKNND
jgi:hypothetical protein